MKTYRTKLSKPLFFNIQDSIYILDRETGVIIQVPRSDYPHLIDVFNNSSNEEDLTSLLNAKANSHEVSNPEFFRMLSKLHTYFSAFITYDVHSTKGITEEEVLRYLYRYGFQELILETTTACNMRCRYCIYSGIYKDFRLHSDSCMSLNTALKAVDMYLRYIEKGSEYNPLRDPSIAFFGGEPLLNFNLIRNVVNYVKYKYLRDYKVRFIISTNGTLLTDEVIDFLLLNSFTVNISLDGPQEEHNRNRIYSNGEGTFRMIMENIEKMRERIMKLGLNKESIDISAQVTFDLRSNLIKIWKFFKTCSIPPRVIGSVRSFGTEYYSQFSKEDIKNFDNGMDTLLKLFLEYIENRAYLNTPDIFFERFYGDIVRKNYYRPLLSKTPIYQYTRSCIPGYKIFVDSKGLLHPCEKTPTKIIIGDVDRGLDMKLIKKIVNKYRERSLKTCYKCSIAHNCPACIAIFGLEHDEENCNKFIKSFLKDVFLLIEVYRKNPKYFLETAFPGVNVNECL
ncbi:MAG: radical SAM protein [Thermoproteota archaeon]